MRDHPVAVSSTNKYTRTMATAALCPTQNAMPTSVASLVDVHCTAKSAPLHAALNMHRQAHMSDSNSAVQIRKLMRDGKCLIDRYGTAPLDMDLIFSR